MTAVIILGGHRCGTSSIAGVVAHLGIPVALPGDEIGPSPSNPRGHFEDATLCRLHQRLLGMGGWREPRAPAGIPIDLLPLYDAHLRRRIDCASRWCVKDPRLCILLPVLADRLRTMSVAFQVVSVARDTEAVAESLRRRQRMSCAAARRIAWLYEGARRAQLGRMIVDRVPLLELRFEEVLADREAAVARLADFLNVDPTPEAVAFLDPSLRHA
ncbi:MAG: hypothetical protein JNG89_02915 [Planctomycetaceae bacterium]|nr:hypothetical protein [Planctomycetaceae bacterium]